MTGDMVFAEKVSYYFRDPEPGDIVTFTDPEIPGRTLIKRCIATAGQTINITGDGILYIDGVAQSETYTHGKPRCRFPTAPSPSPTRCRKAHLGDGRQSHELARFQILRRGPRKLGHGQGRAGILARFGIRRARIAANVQTQGK